MQRLLFFVLALLFVNISLGGASINPYELKGVMIQRIATFIEWPACPKENVSVAVYDDQASYEKFKKVFSSVNFANKEVTIRNIASLNDVATLSPCDILYLGNASSAERAKIIEKIGKKGVLIIGSTREDAKIGAGVVLMEDSQRYKILVNTDALKYANLKADYRLLKLAEIVETK